MSLLSGRVRLRLCNTEFIRRWNNKLSKVAVVNKLLLSNAFNNLHVLSARQLQYTTGLIKMIIIDIDNYYILLLKCTVFINNHNLQTLYKNVIFFIHIHILCRLYKTLLNYNKNVNRRFRL
jgi:hypothetical protein